MDGLGRDLGVAANTVRAHMALLETLFVVTTLPAWSQPAEPRDQDTEGTVEVKTAASISAGDFRGLRQLRDKLGERFKAGVVLYTGEQTVPFEDRLAAVPLSGLWAGTEASRGPS